MISPVTCSVSTFLKGIPTGKVGDPEVAHKQVGQANSGGLVTPGDASSKQDYLIKLDDHSRHALQPIPPQTSMNGWMT